jgi:hypothetical protein
MKIKMRMKIKETLIQKEILLRMTLFNLIEETLLEQNLRLVSCFNFKLGLWLVTLFL